MDNETFETWDNETFGFRSGWLDAVWDLRDNTPGFRRDSQLKAFARPKMTGYGIGFMAFYLAGYDTLVRGYVPEHHFGPNDDIATAYAQGRTIAVPDGSGWKRPERFDLNRLGGLAP